MRLAGSASFCIKKLHLYVAQAGEVKSVVVWVQRRSGAKSVNQLDVVVLVMLTFVSCSGLTDLLAEGSLRADSSAEGLVIPLNICFRAEELAVVCL